MKQNHTLIIVIGVLIIAVLALFAYQNRQANTLPPIKTEITVPPEISEPDEPITDTQPTELAGADPRNTTYTIEGQEITLVGGSAEEEIAPGSASQTTVSVFDDSATGDVNGDDLPDNAVLLNVTTGGSGSYFYIAAALQDKEGMYNGTNAVLVGDRIAPQTNQIVDQEIIVNYADRAEGESFDIQPSVGVSKYYIYENEQLVEKPTL